MQPLERSRKLVVRIIDRFGTCQVKRVMAVAKGVLLSKYPAFERRFYNVARSRAQSYAFRP